MGKKKKQEEEKEETPEEIAAREQVAREAKADAAVSGGSIENIVATAGCSTVGLTLASAIRESIAVGETASFDIFRKQMDGR